MNEQEQAAELATKIAKLLPLGPFNRVTLNDDNAALVIAGLRLLAATPSNLIEQIDQLRGLPEGWDGERAAPTSKQSADEATAFVRGILDGTADATLHADGTVIIESGSSAIRFYSGIGQRLAAAKTPE